MQEPVIPDRGHKGLSLVDKVYSSGNLRASWEKGKENGGIAGIDRQGFESNEKEAEKNRVELDLKQARF
ncbi:hypothetical protein BIY37_08505 [Candidatus Brocadia sapporoensis]|uniref:Uncharacterized protein n=1 Tax=Candidatus Brocadia sapporoensis TaxID=392547 RepID=A0A1V6LZ43_9BACT|nr:hypothetical protein [Candidatus Brocadia sapporoensis]MDG6006254.1 hypothetical protein [Candidatus Brocadia sp.]OQD45428.1 hypothetical protein BIY37_08505 [Candidatus Brocadia sapporoensis]GJQ24905.1 MAG: hypothetical protein HBSAPP01_26950 [Candidatus Brocadia sapporoensis]